MRPWLIYLCVFTAAAAVICGRTVAAAGFGVSPASLDFVLEKGAAASRQLAVYNTGGEAAFTATSSNPGLVAVNPQGGIVAAGEASAIRVTAIGTQKGVRSEEITIALKSRDESAVALSLGIVVPVKIQVLDNTPAANAAIGLAVSAGIVAGGISLYYPLRKRITTNS